MSDSINRQDAIEAIASAIWHYPNLSFLSDYDHARELAEDALKRLPSAETKKWIPCRERTPRGYDGDIVVIDEWQNKPYVPRGLLYTRTIGEKELCYDASEFDFDIGKFLEGKEIEIDGKKYKILPREIIAWMPLPKYLQEDE